MEILVVDDHEDSGELCEIVLQRRGHAVTRAATAAEAKALCEKLRFDVLICDISLPDQSGWDFLPDLRSTCQTPAVAVSGRAMQQDIQRSIQAGYLAHLVKPIQFKRLLDIVDELAIIPPASPDPMPGGSCELPN